MKKILFAADFSDSCISAFNYVLNMTKGKNIIIDIINVYSVSVKMISGLPSARASTHILYEKIESENHLKEMMEKVPLRQRGEYYATYGIYPSSEIAEKASKCNADLVVMALRQKYSMLDRFIGTITAHTISKSLVPVLAIPNLARYIPINNILFPISYVDKKLNQKDLKALEWLRNFSSLFSESSIQMIHINDDKEMDIEFKNIPFDNTNIIKSSAPSLDKGLSDHLGDNVVQIIAFYKKNRSFWERLYYSSMTRKLLYQVRLPLLVFH